MFRSRKYKKSIKYRRLNRLTQRRHRKYKYKRGCKTQRGGNAEFIERKIKEIFPEEKFTLAFTPSMTSFDVYNKGETDYKNLCVSFTILYKDNSINVAISPEEYKRIPKSISIHLLSKCIITGSSTLEKIQLLAHELGAMQINLEDGSTIRACAVSIPLSLLDILATGESWYNSKGYYATNYEAEKVRNIQILARNANEFITACIDFAA
uniref:Uncharacterized protein n=1 Tax=viral metagenome TaxID=1070528 RepID=A0A6C0B1B9_9ZZZZ